MILFIVGACSKEEKGEDYVQQEFKIAAINVCGDTENADILLLCNDGCYILCDAENKDGYSVIYINESVDNNFENGLTAFLDNSGTPVMVSSSDGHYIFKNVKDDRFDFAFINNKNEVSYYNDIKLNFYSRSAFSTRSFFDPWIQSFKSPTGGAWDEHAKKAIIPFLLKIVSFAITASDVVWGTGLLSLHQTFFSELYKSSNLNDKEIENVLYTYGILTILSSSFDFNKYLKSGTIVFTPKSYGLSLLANRLNEYADQQLDKLGQYQKLAGPDFRSEEWQIKLNPNSLEFSPDGGEYFVDVNVDSRVAWDIDDSKIDHSWCEVRKLDVQVFVNVKANTNEYDRTCELIVRPKYSKDISPVTLDIRQTGIVFNLHPDTLSFTQAGGSLGVAVITNENIKSWSVSSYPTWCKIDTIKYSFWVSVGKNEKEDRDDIITVTGITKGGMHVDRTLVVEQKYQLCPDNKHPHMIDLGLPSGTKWACCNIGATKPEDIGSLFAWGETETKESYSWENYRHWKDTNGDGRVDDNEINIGEDISGTSYDAAKTNWGGSWRMPTNADYDELMKNTSIPIYSSEINGRYIIGKNGNKIIMPCNPERYQYWTSVIAKPSSFYPYIGNRNALTFRISYDWTLVGMGPRCDGLYIRPVSK